MDFEAADLFALEASPAFVAIAFLIGDWPLQPLFFGTERISVTEHHAQCHYGHFPKVAPVVVAATDATID